MNQIYRTKSIQLDLQNLIHRTYFTKPNYRKVKSSPIWAELGPVQPQLVLDNYEIQLFQTIVDN